MSLSSSSSSSKSPYNPPAPSVIIVGSSGNVGIGIATAFRSLRWSTVCIDPTPAPAPFSSSYDEGCSASEDYCNEVEEEEDQQEEKTKEERLSLGKKNLHENGRWEVRGTCQRGEKVGQRREEKEDVEDNDDDDDHDNKVDAIRPRHLRVSKRFEEVTDDEWASYLLRVDDDNDINDDLPETAGHGRDDMPNQQRRVTKRMAGTCGCSEIVYTAENGNRDAYSEVPSLGSENNARFALFVATIARVLEGVTRQSLADGVVGVVGGGDGDEDEGEIRSATKDNDKSVDNYSNDDDEEHTDHEQLAWVSDNNNFRKDRTIEDETYKVQISYIGGSWTRLSMDYTTHDVLPNSPTKDGGGDNPYEVAKTSAFHNARAIADSYKNIMCITFFDYISVVPNYAPNFSIARMVRSAYENGTIRYSEGNHYGRPLLHRTQAGGIVASLAVGRLKLRRRRQRQFPRGGSNCLCKEQTKAENEEQTNGGCETIDDGKSGDMAENENGMMNVGQIHGTRSSSTSPSSYSSSSSFDYVLIPGAFTSFSYYASLARNVVLKHRRQHPGRQNLPQGRSEDNDDDDDDDLGTTESSNPPKIELVAIPDDGVSTPRAMMAKCPVSSELVAKLARAGVGFSNVGGNVGGIGVDVGGVLQTTTATFEPDETMVREGLADSARRALSVLLSSSSLPPTPT